MNLNEIHDVKISFVVTADRKATTKVIDKVVKLLNKCNIKFITINDEASIDLDTEEAPNIQGPEDENQD